MTSKKPKVVATVEARMGSTRLPGKTLKTALGRPMLELLLERLGRAESVDQIVVATTELAEDDAIERLCRRLKVACFRGSSEDVLDRVAKAAQQARADIVVEITGDCPLTCPEVVDEAVALFLKGGATTQLPPTENSPPRGGRIPDALPRGEGVGSVGGGPKQLQGGMDYLSNLKEQTYPQAVDVRVFRAGDLKEINEKLAGNDPAAREHVYLYFEEHPERYRVFVMKAPPEFHRPEWRLDLDYPEDLVLLTKIFEALYPRKPDFGLAELVAFLDANPELMKINQGMPRKPLRPEAARHAR